MIFNPVKLASSKQSFGMILAIGAFIWNSIDLLLIPWSKEGQSSYPYRYSSLVFLKYSILLAFYLLFITFSIILKRLYPKNKSQHVVLDPVELEIFDTVMADESSDDNEDTGFFGEASTKRSLARKVNEEHPRTLRDAVIEGRVFFWNGLMILLMEICIFNILEHIPAATFAIIRNLVIPCTALIRGVWLKEKPSGIQWLALIGITAVASSFASQEASFYASQTIINASSSSSSNTAAETTSVTTEWVILGAFLMITFIALESVNIVYMERQFKETQMNHSMRFTEQQFWVTLYCVLLTFTFWCYDSIGSGYALFYGYSVKTVFLLFWRVFHAIIIFWMVRYLTSVVAMLVHTIASIGTTLLDWMIMQTVLTSGQWFDALAVASLVMIYKIAPYEQHKESRRFEILQVEDDDDESL
mmetsp:Transcript_64813/g.103126  ORF Transcript_64813/g.103126 Transcript_64813/m.103126 type:complete len:416 (+) Transcript_64813:42-1289(+)|eukprot:CAMPEP_0197041710 /NCGR_PEP_ID=MMETSP1384-20130603/18223_1 /TAXON_ID=29189 /ORGANISM="Ammonia sp." /LENGTH=415 /DNA_ID=CAMNT_0042472689 /DNA_START=36 /DNA_END=1283 /DNA_ORIENTATION=-